MGATPPFYVLMKQLCCCQSPGLWTTCGPPLLLDAQSGLLEEEQQLVCAPLLVGGLDSYFRFAHDYGSFSSLVF